MLSSRGNNLSGYDGLTFSVTPNSGNEKTTFKLVVGSTTVSFPINSGTNDYVLHFADYSITPTSSMDVKIQVSGGNVSNLTISDIYAYKGTVEEETTTPSSATEITTTTNAPSSLSTTKLIDWDVNNNFYVNGTTVSNDSNGIRVQRDLGQRIINTWSNKVSSYDGIIFTVDVQSGNVADTFWVQVGPGDSVSENYRASTKLLLTSGVNNLDFSFDEIGVDTSNNNTEINFWASGGTVDLVISDIYVYTGTPDVPELTLTMADGASMRIGSVNGIRFTTYVNETQLANLIAKGYTVEFGTLIAPADAVEGDLTFDSPSKSNVPYNVELYEGTIRGSIINIKESNNYNATSGNIARTFIARGYAKVTKNNVTTYIYSTENSDGRSLAEVASAFKQDAGYSLISSAHKALVDKWSGYYV